MLEAITSIEAELKKVSIICPCFNEAPYISDFLHELKNQKYPFQLIEFLIVDGGSDDGTLLIIQDFVEKNSQFRLVHNPYRTAPFAMNLALKQALGAIIIRMDIHASYPKNYVDVLTKKLDSNPSLGNVGCVLKTAPANEGSVAKGIAYAMSSNLGVGGAKFRVGVKEDTFVDTVPFGCFHKELFNHIGFYNENLTRSQDYEMNSRIRLNGYKILLTPDLTVTYYTRENYKKLVLMHFQSAYTKVLSYVFLKHFFGLRQLVPPAFLIIIFSSLILGIFLPKILTFSASLVLVYLSTITIYSTSYLLGKESFLVIFHMITSMIFMHTSYALGYLTGIFDFLVLKKEVPLNKLKITR